MECSKEKNKKKCNCTYEPCPRKIGTVPLSILPNLYMVEKSDNLQDGKGTNTGKWVGKLNFNPA